MTAPYRADTEDTIRGPHRQAAWFWATHPSFAAPIPLDVEAATVTWDEDQAPRVSASLRCRVPSTQEVLDALDPRTGVRVYVEAGYVRPGGARDVHPFVDLGLRERRVNRPGNTMDLVAASDEALVIDAAPAVAQSVNEADASSAIRALIGSAMSPTPLVTVREGGGTATALPDITDRWSTIRDLADRAALAVYDAGLRAWVIERRPLDVGTADAVLQVGAQGTVETSDSEVARDGWFNYVLFTYKWRDGAGNDQQVVSTAFVDSGPYAITGPAGRKIYQEDRDTPTDQENANAATRSLVARHISRGRTMTLSAVSALWLRPGMTVTVRLPLGPQERHLLSRVTFDLVEGRMTLSTRLPVTDYTISTTTQVPVIPSSPPPPDPDPTPPPKAVYQSGWAASDRASYRQSGAKRTDTSALYQGYFSGTNGNQQALAVFTAANSYGSENGLTLAQALTAATVTRVEVYLQAVSWYYNSGGVARVGSRAVNAVPGTFTGAVGGADVGDWQAGEARWVDITGLVDMGQLAAGNFAVTVGPGNGTDRRFYGSFDGTPHVRITYQK